MLCCSSRRSGRSCQGFADGFCVRHRKLTFLDCCLHGFQALEGDDWFGAAAVTPGAAAITICDVILAYMVTLVADLISASSRFGYSDKQ